MVSVIRRSTIITDSAETSDQTERRPSSDAAARSEEHAQCDQAGFIEIARWCGVADAKISTALRINPRLPAGLSSEEDPGADT